MEKECRVVVLCSRSRQFAGRVSGRILVCGECNSGLRGNFGVQFWFARGAYFKNRYEKILECWFARGAWK